MSSRNAEALYRAHQRIFQRRIDSAKTIIDRALVKSEHGFVSFSGGKDSTVLADLVRRRAPDIPCIWSDDEWWMPETGEYMDRMRAAGMNLLQIRTKTRHTEWWKINGPETDLQRFAKKQDIDLVFLGLRTEESKQRSLTLFRQGPLALEKDGFWHCNPLWDWTWQDIWAYILSRNLDYNRAYDKLDDLGVPPERQRIGPLAVDRVLGFGQIAILKRGWPDLYDRFVAEHPEAGTYQ